MVGVKGGSSEVLEVDSSSAVVRRLLPEWFRSERMNLYPSIQPCEV